MGRHSSTLGAVSGRHAVPVITTLPERRAICGYVNPVANRASESVCTLAPGHLTGHRFGAPSVSAATDARMGGTAWDPDAWIYE